MVIEKVSLFNFLNYQTKINRLQYECTISEGPRKLVNIGKKQYFCDVADVGKVSAELS